MRVTKKGQVTIPKHIRDKLGVKPGNEVWFVDNGADGVRLMAAKSTDVQEPASFEEWLAAAKGTIDLQDKMVDEVMFDIRGPRDDIDAG